MIKKIMLFIFCVFVFSTTCNAEIVTRVIDGDTIQLENNEKIRLYGIDAPEKQQKLGKEATEKLKELILNKNIVVNRINKDVYNRTVAIIYLNKKCVQEILLDSGYVWYYKEYCREDICDSWKKRETIDHNNNVPPWTWRKLHKGNH